MRFKNQDQHGYERPGVFIASDNRFLTSVEMPPTANPLAHALATRGRLIGAAS